MPKQPLPPPDRSHLIAGIPHILNTLERTQTLHNWMAISEMLQIAASKGAPVTRKAFLLTGDACMDATAIALRALEDFLFDSRKGGKPKDDDILAEDYGYSPASGAAKFLSKAQRDAINKRIMHLSTERIDGHTIKMDPNACLMVVPLMRESLAHLETKFLTQSDSILTQVTEIRRCLENQETPVIDPLIGAGPPFTSTPASGSDQSRSTHRQ